MRSFVGALWGSFGYGKVSDTRTNNLDYADRLASEPIFNRSHLRWLGCKCRYRAKTGHVGLFGP